MLNPILMHQNSYAGTHQNLNIFLTVNSIDSMYFWRKEPRSQRPQVIILEKIIYRYWFQSRISVNQHKAIEMLSGISVFFNKNYPDKEN